MKRYKLKIKEEEPIYPKDDDWDEHLGCPAWPNCDIDPLGCFHQTKLKDIQWYGHRG